MITSSTVTSHNSQLLKNFHVARNLASRELLCGCDFFCASLSLLHFYSFLLVHPLSMGCPVLVLCYFCDITGVFARWFSDCAAFLIWPSSALTSCSTAFLDRTFSVMALGLYVPVYSFGAFSIISIIEVWTCGVVHLCIG